MENIEKRLGSVVRSLRLAAGLTQENLARQLTAEGLPTRQNTVAKLENGLRPTPVSELAALATIFNLSLAELSDAISPSAMDEKAIAAARVELNENKARIRALHQNLEYLQDVMYEMRNELMEREMRAAMLEARVGPDDLEVEHPKVSNVPLRGSDLDESVSSILKTVGKAGIGQHPEKA